MLEILLNGLHFDNPLILASGILDESGDSMLRVAHAGAGGIVTKSIGTKERNGYENPVIYKLPNNIGIINAIGLANPGIENFREEILTALQAGVPIIGSVFGSNPDEFAYLSEKMEDYGAHAVELNLSCPHAKGYGMEIGVDSDLVEEIILTVKKSIHIPVWAKLTPNTHNLIGIAKAAENADALVLINTVRGMAIDIDARMPVLKNIYGGISGPCIKPVGIRAVYEIRKELETPIVGVGGITSGRDVLEYMMAGANAVELGTAVIYRGIQVFRKINAEIKDWMNKNEITNINELVGIAQRR